MLMWPSRVRIHGGWIAAALLALALPIAAAAVFSFVPANRYQSTSWIIVDAARGSQAIASSADERRGNEVITYDQVLKTQLSIAGSEDVIRRAIRGMAPVRLYPQIPETDAVPSTEDRELAAVRNDMTLAIEPNTFILKISFRHKDPVISAKFTNLLASEFLARRSSLYSNQGDADFFRGQEVRYNDELRVASASLERFGTERGVYSVAEQRRLLLEARANMSKEVTNNTTQIARAESELASLKVQLQALRRKTTLPPEIYGDLSSSSATLATRQVRRDDTLADDPPLLNIKIYQDGAARLVAMNAELAGLKATELQRSADLQMIDGQLNALAAHEARFNSLRRQVAQAEGYIDSLSKRAGEARINDAWRSNEAFSSAQVLQVATPQTTPVSPRPVPTMAGGIMAGLFLAAGILYVAMIRFPIAAEEDAPRTGSLTPVDGFAAAWPMPGDLAYPEQFAPAHRRRGVSA